MILFVGVAASWIGVPIVGAGVLAAAGILASNGELNLGVVLVTATAAACAGGFAGYLLGVRLADAIAADADRPWRGLRQAIGVGEALYRRWGRRNVPDTHVGASF